MDRYDPRTWDAGYVRRNERDCVDVLEVMAGGLKECVREGDYATSIQGCDVMCNALSMLAQECGGDRYAPMLYAYSFILAELCLFGIGGERGLRAGIPPLLDAYDFARSCARPGRRTAERASRDARKMEGMIDALKREEPLSEVRRKYCPDFPYDIINGN